MSAAFEWCCGPIATKPDPAPRYVKRAGKYVENPVKARRVVYGQLRFRTGAILNWGKQAVDGEESESLLAWAKSKFPRAADNDDSFKPTGVVVQNEGGYARIPEEPTDEDLGEFESGIFRPSSGDRLPGYEADDNAAITLFEWQRWNGVTRHKLAITTDDTTEIAEHFDTKDNFNWTPKDAIGLDLALKMIARRDEPVKIFRGAI